MAFRRLGLPLEPSRPQLSAPRRVATKEPSATVGAVVKGGSRTVVDTPHVVTRQTTGPGPGKASSNGSTPEVPTKRRANLLVPAAKVAGAAGTTRAAKPQLRARQDVVEDVGPESGKKASKDEDVGPESEKKGKILQPGRNLLGSVLMHLGSSARKRLQLDEKKAEKRPRPKIVQLSQPGSTSGVMKSTLKPKLRVTKSSVKVEENTDLEVRLAEHYSHMMNFIRTKAEPILFYLPATHNAESQRCLEETQKTIRRKIEMLPTHLGGELEAEE